MRGLTRRRRVEDEEESVFVSMTDLTVSFLFILMVLVAFLATRIGESAETVSADVHAQVLKERSEALARVQALEALLAAREAALAAAEAEIEALRRDLEAALGRARAAEAGLAEERTARAAAEADLDRAGAEIRRLRTLLDEAEDRLEALLAGLEKLRLDLDAAEERRREREEALRLSAASLRAAEARVAEVAREAEALRRQIAALEAERTLGSLRDRAVRDRLAADLETVARNLNARFPDARVRALRDVLRFEGEGIFARGRWDVAPARRSVVDALADEIGAFLPCLTVLPEPDRVACGPDRPYLPVMETVLIEGHTDLTGTEAANLDLSTRRALTTFAAMTERVPRLKDLRNRFGQTLIAVAGYGWQRPVVATGPGIDEPRNRRIDIRFILLSGGGAP